MYREEAKDVLVMMLPPSLTQDAKKVGSTAPPPPPPSPRVFSQCTSLVYLYFSQPQVLTYLPAFATDHDIGTGNRCLQLPPPRLS